jgi:hypothetical protein
MKTVTTILLIAMSIYTCAANIDTALLEALAAVESNITDSAFNPSEGAYGRYQIRNAYLADANRILGTAYILNDMHDPEKAERVVRAYLLHYGSLYEARTGEQATQFILACIHNGGPRGYDKEAANNYAERVVELMGELAK